MNCYLDRLGTVNCSCLSLVQNSNGIFRVALDIRLTTVSSIHISHNFYRKSSSATTTQACVVILEYFNVATMHDPFEVRMQFLGLIRKLNA